MTAPDESEECICPSCREAFAARHLVFKSFSTESCPKCGAECGRSEGFHYQQADVINSEDMAAIDQWMDAVGKAHNLQVARSAPSDENAKYYWRVTGLKIPWGCEAAYSLDRPNVLEIRLFTDQRGAAAYKDAGSANRLWTILAEHGVHPHGSRQSNLDAAAVLTSQMDFNEVREGEVVWGAAQLLTTAVLPVELFMPIVRRLDGAMRDALTYFSR